MNFTIRTQLWCATLAHDPEAHPISISAQEDAPIIVRGWGMNETRIVPGDQAYFEVKRYGRAMTAIREFFGLGAWRWVRTR